MIRKIKSQIVKYLVKNLLIAVTEDDILRISNKGWFVGSHKVSPEEVALLKEQAKDLEESVLWKFIKRELRYTANLRMFEKSATEGNSEFGRAMLYNLQMIETFIKQCKKL